MREDDTIRLSAAATLTVSFATDFLLGAGTALAAAMAQQGDIQLPAVPVWILALILGTLAGARRWQALLADPPRLHPQRRKREPEEHA